jgi:plastocyanin
VSALAFVATGCGAEADSPSVDLSDQTFEALTEQADVEVDAVDNKFVPPYVEVSRGTTVTFTNDGRNPHNVLPSDGGAFAPIETEAFQPEASGSVRFDRVGDYPYYCSLHGTSTKGMVGAIRVVD